MKHTLTSTLGLSVVLVAVVALLSACAPSAPAKATTTTTAPAHKKMWTCSMHPQIRLDHPGACPICGMNLVPVDDDDIPAPAAGEAEAAHHHEGPRLSLNAAQSSIASIETAAVKNETLLTPLTIFGDIRYVQDQHIDFTWVYGGLVQKVLIPYSTTDVQKDQPLVEVYSEEAIADQQAYLQAVRDRYLTTFYERKIADAQVEVVRQKLLRAGMTEAELKDLVEHKAIRTVFTLRAPMAGSLVAELPSAGARFSADKALFHLADLRTVWFQGRVHEQDLPALQPNEPAEVRVQAFPGERFLGGLVFIDRSLDPVSRTLEVRVLLPNAEKRLLPFMAGEATLLAQSAGPVLVVPQSAVIDTGTRQVVYVKTEAGAYRPQAVEVGRKGRIAGSTDDFIEIKNGLAQGDEVVSVGAFLLDAEAQLKGVEGHQH